MYIVSFNGASIWYVPCVLPCVMYVSSAPMSVLFFFLHIYLIIYSGQYFCRKWIKCLLLLLLLSWCLYAVFKQKKKVFTSTSSSCLNTHALLMSHTHTSVVKSVQTSQDSSRGGGGGQKVTVFSCLCRYIRQMQHEKLMKAFGAKASVPWLTVEKSREWKGGVVMWCVHWNVCLCLGPGVHFLYLCYTAG